MGGARFAGFLVQRVIKMVVMVFAIIVANFLLVHAAPGDPASVIAGEAGAADPQFLAQLRTQFGLDQPLSTQLWLYVSHVAQGDLGVSYRQQRPVLGLILERLSATLLLTGTAFILAVIGGVTLGALAARRVGRTSDSLITVLALGLYATPIFWVGLMLVLVFSVWLDWLPSFGMNTVGADLTGGAAVLDTARYLLLPALTLGLFYMAVYARLTRAAMLEVASQDFVRTARAKGVPEGGVQRRHVLRNALLPVITVAGIQAGQLVGGSILVETVFAWPGTGFLLNSAIFRRDLPILQGTTLVLAGFFMLLNLTVDVIQTMVDPRIKRG
jgi:peptide/nickel transport system permease protein